MDVDAARSSPTMPLPRRELTTIWIDLRTIQEIIAETARTLPLETGGMLIGYWSDDTRDAVIVDTIAPGPAAIHARAAFVSDGEWQQQRLEEIYRHSGRIHTYLGDWHSHPHGEAAPSPRDRHTARVVAAEQHARAPHPITLIVAASPSLAVSAFVRRRRRLVDASVQPY